MSAFLFADGNLPFTIAAGLLLALALIELLGLLLTGVGLSSMLDSVAGHLHLDADGAADSLLGWLHVGRVPMLALLSLLLTGFAASGYVVQWFAQGLFGATLPALLAVVPATLGGAWFVRRLAPKLALLVPRTETSSINRRELVGFPGRIVTGKARRGMPAEVAVRDAHGVTHYLMAEPEKDADVIAEGTEVIVVAHASGDRWLVAPIDKVLAAESAQSRH